MFFFIYYFFFLLLLKLGLQSSVRSHFNFNIINLDWSGLLYQITSIITDHKDHKDHNCPS